MLNHYRGAFGNVEGLVLGGYRRENTETEKPKRDFAGYTQIESKAINRAKGMALLRQSDKKRYGPLLTKLENQFSRHNDQYPTDMTEAFYLLVNYKTQERTSKGRKGDGKEIWPKKREKRQVVGDETVLIQDGESRTTKRFYAGINCYNRGNEGHYADDCDKSDRRNDNDNDEEGTEVQVLNHEGESDNEGFDFSFVNTRDNRSEYFESDEDLDDDQDLTLQDYSYVRNPFPIHDPSPDGTDCNVGDGSDNILYPHLYIEYPKDGNEVELTSDDETYTTVSDDDDNDSDTYIDGQSSDATCTNITTLTSINREIIKDECDFDTEISSERCLTTITKNKHGNVNPDWILLDSQYTISLFYNDKLLSNIREYEKGQEKLCYCNGGIQDSNMIGDLQGFGIVYFNPQSIANILSLAEVVKSRRVTFDSKKGNKFRVFGGGRNMITFRQSEKGLYFWDVKSRHDEEVIMINSVKENEKRYSKREVR